MELFNLFAIICIVLTYLIKSQLTIQIYYINRFWDTTTAVLKYAFTK